MPSAEAKLVFGGPRIMLSGAGTAVSLPKKVSKPHSTLPAADFLASNAGLRPPGASGAAASSVLPLAIPLEPRA